MGKNSCTHESMVSYHYPPCIQDKMVIYDYEDYGEQRHWSIQSNSAILFLSKEFGMVHDEVSTCWAYYAICSVDGLRI